MKTRILSIFLTAVMLIGIIPLASCGGSAKPVKSRVDHVYKATELDLGGKVSPRTMISAGDDIIIYGNELISEEPYQSQTVLVRVNPSTGESTKTTLEQSDNGYVQSIAADQNGDILLLVQSYDEKTQTQNYSLAKLVDGKNETLKEDLNSLFEEDDNEFGRRYFYIDSFTVDGDGNIYMTCDSSIVVFDKSYNKLFEIAVDGYTRGMGVTADGRVYVSYRDNNARTEQVSYIDVKKKDFGEQVPLPNDRSMNNVEFYVGNGYDIYYKNSGSLYGFNAADGAPTELLNFINSDIDPDTVNSLAVIDQDNMICSTYDYSDGRSNVEVLLLKRIPEEEIPEKYVIRLAYRSNGGGSLGSLAVKFNRASDEYRVELIDYAKFATDDDYSGKGQLESEILAGTAPDIVAVNYFDGSDNWIAQGAFTDLNKLMNKDESFDRSKYFQSVFDAYTDEKGRLFQFVVSFDLQTILANGDYIDFDTWDAAKFIDFASNIPEGKYLADYFSREMMLYLPLACSMDSFIDYKKATCSFDSDEFRKLLELVKNTPEHFSYYESLTEEEKQDYEEDRDRPYREGKILLDTDNSSIYGLDSYAKATVAYGEGKKVVFLGYPTNHGNGAIMSPEMSFAISDKSAVKEGAWEFIKLVSSTKSARRAYWGFPSNIELFDAACGEQLGYWNYYTSNGTWGFGDTTREEVMERLESIWKREGKKDGVLVQTSQEHVDGLKALINGAQALPNLENKVFEIINEEAAMYYSDAKSLDETVKIIQDRISTYIAEIS